MRLPILLLCCIVLSACVKEDTCNHTLGTSCREMSFATLNRNAAGETTVFFDLVTLDELPEAYYADAQLDPSETDEEEQPRLNTAELLIHHQLTANHLLFYLKASALPAVGNVKSYAFYFDFPDRTDYIDCFSPSYKDAYRLRVEFDLRRIEPNKIALEQLDWEEVFTRGVYD